MWGGDFYLPVRSRATQFLAAPRAERSTSQAERRSRVPPFEMSTSRALVSFLVLAAAVSSCAAPLQNGGVEVRPGVEERLGMLCRYRSGSREAAEVCVDPGAAENEQD